MQRVFTEFRHFSAQADSTECAKYLADEIFHVFNFNQFFTACNNFSPVRGWKPKRISIDCEFQEKLSECSSFIGVKNHRKLFRLVWNEFFVQQAGQTEKFPFLGIQLEVISVFNEKFAGKSGAWNSVRELFYLDVILVKQKRSWREANQHYAEAQFWENGF